MCLSVHVHALSIVCGSPDGAGEETDGHMVLCRFLKAEYGIVQFNQVWTCCSATSVTAKHLSLCHNSAGIQSATHTTVFTLGYKSASLKEQGKQR